MKLLNALAQWMGPRAKAVAGGAMTVVLQLLVDMRDGLTLDEIITLVMLAGTVSGIVYAVPNQTTKR